MVDAKYFLSFKICRVAGVPTFCIKVNRTLLNCNCVRTNTSVHIANSRVIFVCALLCYITLILNRGFHKTLLDQMFVQFICKLNDMENINFGYIMYAYVSHVVVYPPPSMDVY